MIKLNLNQITSTLNNEFNKEGRSLIFWYDERKEFYSEIENLKLDNAKILVLSHNELFKAKILLERQDKDSNYLVYAPFKQPKNKENHLADTIMYSKIFSTDWISLIVQELGLKEEYKDILEKYNKFFTAKERREKFIELVRQFPINSSSDISILMMKVITKSKANSMEKFDDIVRILISDSDRKESKYMKEFERYGLDIKFWELCKLRFGYNEENESLTKFLIGIFLTYASSRLKKDFPKSVKLLSQKGTIMTFVSSLKMSVVYRDDFKNMTDEVYRMLGEEKYFKNFLPEHMLELDIFEFPDRKIQEWITERLIDENITAKLDEKSILEIIEVRRNLNIQNEKLNLEYKMLEYAYKSIENIKNIKSVFFQNLTEIIKQYSDKDFIIDTYYRKFYYYFDKLREENEKYRGLAQIIDNKYIEEFLNPVNIKFGAVFNYDELDKIKFLKLQKSFYKNNVELSKNRIVVIISDALRYEVGKELISKMNKDEKIEAEIETQISLMPSITKLGMAALLPHESIEITSGENNEFKILVDGKPCDDRIKREKILQKYDENSVALNFEDVKKANKSEIREMFKEKKKIYIYHNKIDAIGDNHKTEDEVFNACSETMDEIIFLVKKLGSESVNNILITSDHGFIYKRRETEEYDKIENISSKEDIVNKRYIITDKDYDTIGIQKIELSKILNNKDENRLVLSPNTSNIFKVSGGGQNYFHGGMSLQELIIPLIKVKTKRGNIETGYVEMDVLNNISRITSLTVSVEIYQKTAVSDVIKPAEYQIYFTDEEQNVISNIENFKANIESEETGQRIFKKRFNLKNQKYNKKKNYYFIIRNVETEVEIVRQKIEIDILFSDDFGF